MCFLFKLEDSNYNDNGNDNHDDNDNNFKIEVLSRSSYFWSHRKPPGKKRRVKKESDWKKYYGSCPELKEDIERLGRQNFSRTILSLHKTPGKTNFEETKQLFLNGVLTESLDTGGPAYYNGNILSRYFRKDYYGGD